MTEKTIRSPKTQYTFSTKDVLGRGAYGSVYKGLDKSTNQPVAIKIMGDVKYIKNPAKIAESANREIAMFKHVIDLPNVIKMIEYIQEKKDIYIIMEFCEGGTLRQLLRKQKEKRFTESEAVKHLRGIARGVYELHQRNIMHKDLNLDNVLIRDGQCIIGDLGSAVRKKEIA